MENIVQITGTSPNQVDVVGAEPVAIEVQQPASAEVVVVSANGPQGAQGPPNLGYFFTQASPSSQWTINHNLGFRPSVELFDSGGNEFDADILHVSNNQVMVYLTAPYSGFARLN